MTPLYIEYLPIAIFIAFAGGLSVLFAISSWLIGKQLPDSEKLSPYECGFEPFEDARIQFDVRFYLVAILFIIFDLEIAFLFPLAIVIHDVGIYGLISMAIFLFILIIGFIYEWKKGALEWD